jgi:hypothetical protein
VPGEKFGGFTAIFSSHVLLHSKTIAACSLYRLRIPHYSSLWQLANGRMVWQHGRQMTIKRLAAILLILLYGSLTLPAVTTAAAIRARRGQAAELAGEAFADKKKAAARQFTCLPDAFDVDEIIAYRTSSNGKEVTVKLKDKLIELKASCRDGRLVDHHQREIKLFRLACFGNPPADYDEIEQRQQQELSRLKKQYTVIIIECNPHLQ